MSVIEFPKHTEKGSRDNPPALPEGVTFSHDFDTHDINKEFVRAVGKFLDIAHSTVPVIWRKMMSEFEEERKGWVLSIEIKVERREEDEPEGGKSA